MKVPFRFLIAVVVALGVASTPVVAQEDVCAEFSNQEDAQAAFEAAGGLRGEASALDPDEDMFACEEYFASDDRPASVREEVFVRSETYVVRLLGDGTEELQRPDDPDEVRARRGDVLEYRLIITNGSRYQLNEGIVKVLGFIPEGTTFIPGSATETSERITTEFSGDGGNTYSEGNTSVEPDAFNVIRWTLRVPLVPDQQETFSYRVEKD